MCEACVAGGSVWGAATRGRKLIEPIHYNDYQPSSEARIFIYTSLCPLYAPMCATSKMARWHRECCSFSAAPTRRMCPEYELVACCEERLRALVTHRRSTVEAISSSARIGAPARSRIEQHRLSQPQRVASSCETCWTPTRCGRKLYVSR